jgi:hypothetical protein
MSLFKDIISFILVISIIVLGILYPIMLLHFVLGSIITLFFLWALIRVGQIFLRLI